MDTQPKKQGRPRLTPEEKAERVRRHRENTKRWLAAHPEATLRYRNRTNAALKARYKVDPAYRLKVSQASKAWRAAHPERDYTATVIACRKRRQAQAFALLGGCCAHCGEKRPPVLVIDHIKPLRCGARRAKLHESTTHIYTKVLRDPVEAAKTYQILCANCNMAKGTGDVVPLEKVINWRECGN